MNWITENIILIITIVLAVYEVLVSYFPTLANYSIVDVCYRILRMFVPNKRIVDSTDRTSVSAKNHIDKVN